jgi:XTP/dITP diphosphohydrolase
LSALERIVVASENAGKARELEAIFAELFRGVHVLRPSELGVKIAYPDEGASYAENATAKATAAATQTGLPAVADDSGIEVDALGGAPGVLSARYDIDDEARNRRLLRELAAFPEPSLRGAQYRAVAAFAWPDGRALTAEGVWRGVIIQSPRGAGGFGYDPIFLDLESGKTGGEMTPEEKAARSHRGHALRTLAGRIRGELGNS